MIVLVSGPSGAGKSSVIEDLKSKGHKDVVFDKSISLTTRQIRDGEKNGREYYFVSPEEFESLINENYFFEYVKYHNNYYGVPRNNLTLDNKHVTLFDVLCSSGQKFINSFDQEHKDGKLQSFYINAPSKEILNNRRGNRGDSRYWEDVKQSNIAKNLYDWYLINQDVKTTSNNMNNIINYFLYRNNIEQMTNKYDCYSMNNSVCQQHLNEVLSL